MQKQPSREAIEAFNSAESAYQAESLDNGESLRFVAGLFASAVKKAGDTYLPKVHRRYGELLLALGQLDLALRHVDIALQQDPKGVNGFWAQNTKIYILGNKGIKTFARNLGTGDFVHNRGVNNADNIAETIVGSIFKSLVAGGVSASILRSQSQFWDEVKKLGQIFLEVHKINTDPSLFVAMAEAMTKTADYISDFPQNKTVNLCKYVAEAALEKMSFQSPEQKSKVLRVHSIHVGRSAMF